MQDYYIIDGTSKYCHQYNSIPSKTTQIFEFICFNLYSDHPNLPYVGYYNYLKPALLIRDPDIIKDIIITDYNHFQAMEMVINEKLDPLLGANPFVLTGDKWKSKRQALTQVITPTKVLF